MEDRVRKGCYMNGKWPMSQIWMLHGQRISLRVRYGCNMDEGLQMGSDKDVAFMESGKWGHIRILYSRRMGYSVRY